MIAIDAILERGDEYLLNRTINLSEEANFSYLILKRKDQCYIETHKAQYWEKQLEDRTTVIPAVAAARAFTPFMEELKEEVLLKYYGT